MRIIAKALTRAISAVLLIFVVTGIVRAQAPSERAGANAGSSMIFGGADEPLALWLAHTESTNVLGSASGNRGSYDSLGAMFNFARERERLQAALFGELELRRYGGDVAEEEPVGTLGAFAKAVLVPERFTWSFEESYGQARTDPFGADTPLNREAINVFTTRPEINVPFGERTDLRLGGSYSVREHEDSTAFDSDVTSFDIGLYRLTGRATTLGLVAETSEIEYDVAAMSYEIDSLRVTYERLLASGSASASIGTNKLTLGSSESTGPLVALAWSRALTPRSTLVLTANRRFTDAGRLYSLSADRVGVVPTDVLLTSEPTKRSEAGVSYSLDLVRTTVVLQGAAFDDDFERDPLLNSDGVELNLEIRRELTALMRGGFGLNNQRRTFSAIDTEYDDVRFRFWLSRQLGRSVDLEVLAQRTERSGINSFKSNEYRISLVFIPRRR